MLTQREGPGGRFRRARMTPRERELLRSLLRTTTAIESAGIVGITPNTARTLKRQWRIRRERIKTAPAPAPSEPIEALRERLGFATVEPVIRDLVLAYEDGKSARRRWGESALCPYQGEHAEAWRLGVSAGSRERAR